MEQPGLGGGGGGAVLFGASIKQVEVNAAV